MGFTSLFTGIICLVGAILLPRFSIWLLIPAIVALLLGFITVLSGIFKKRADNFLAGLGILLSIAAIIISSGFNFSSNQSLSDIDALSNFYRASNSVTEPLPLIPSVMETPITNPPHSQKSVRKKSK